MDGTVIVADDDRTIRTVLSQALTRAGCRVRSTSTIATMWQWIEAGEGDVVVSDVMMPDGDALDLMPAIKRKRPNLPIIIMSAQNTVMTAVRANEAGVYEYLPKPFDLREVLGHVNKALSTNAPSTSNKPDKGETVEPSMPLIGGSSAMQDVYRIIARLTNTDLGVMITGESGTGKALVARTLHDFGHRAQHPFVTVNFASIAEDTLEAELFGRDNGAAEPTIGKLEQAESGTLYLDEVGDIPAEAQRKLLRVLQDGSFRRVGGTKDIASNFRIVASSNQDLRALINEGQMREDLFYRINVVPIRLPVLSDRADDIPDLVRHFLKNASRIGLPAKSLTSAAIDRLMREPWPGNVRELENFVQRLLVLGTGDVIDVETIEEELAQHSISADLPDFENSQKLSGSVQQHLQRYFDMHGDELPLPGLYQRILKEVEMPLFAITLAATHGNQIKAAELLGINRNTLRKKIRALDINVTRGKKMM